MRDRIICGILGGNKFQASVGKKLKDHFDVLATSRFIAIQKFIRCYPMNSVIVHICNCESVYWRNIEQIKQLYPDIPIIGLLDNENLELARMCGEIGVNRVLLIDDIETLIQVITNIDGMTIPQIAWEKYNIDIDQCSFVVKEALTLVNKKLYENISVNEIADIMSVSVSTLSRRFKNECGVGLKRLIIMVKISQSIKLMKNPGYNITEISEIIGFANKHRFHECFNREVGIAPGEYRKRNILGLVSDISTQYSFQSGVDENGGIIYCNV